jgi:hypothetical protein
LLNLWRALCCKFTSGLLPCIAKCAVYACVQNALFHVSTLRPRWRICHYSQYDVCLQKFQHS